MRKEKTVEYFRDELARQLREGAKVAGIRAERVCEFSRIIVHAEDAQGDSLVAVCLADDSEMPLREIESEFRFHLEVARAMA